ncbi:GAF and ANTAR domain-containing protein [Prauserella cavernicola]|uniref:GAF and ANTAR domain-containing protein n=1 Tax=Prauserella cavernicola TaxID=2800127 RepID=A0A934QPQ7_9PSEU|nr:GAF and ANTAR domain-containing protein [Prauserella cavernicola]MBK1785932.1 GAF and ANTAR domain-containing protein [Prauserella cavernicola]
MTEELTPAAEPGQQGAALASALSKVARSLEPEPDVDRTVEQIVAAAAITVPGAEQAGVSFLDSGRMRSVAPSNDLVANLDQWQHELREGPCVDAVFDAPVYLTRDLALDERWPRFSELAVGAGIRSMLSFRLFTSTRVIGALNHYSSLPDAFDSEAERIGELFAAHAAIALAGSRGLEQLQNALRTRDVIGMAKGILMQRNGVGPDRAFEILVEASQHANIKLRDAAQWLVDEASR